MLKKVVLGTVLAIFIGVLITGAVIRTMDKSEPTAAAAGSGGGNGRNVSLENTVLSEDQGYGQGGGRSTEDRSETAATGRGRGGERSELLVKEESDRVWDRSGEVGSEAVVAGRGAGGNGGGGFELLADEKNDYVWDVYLGVVTDVAECTLTIETNDGELVIVEGQAWTFAQEQGYTIQQGDRVQIEGFYEDDEFKVSVIENLITGESVLLRDTNGRTSWAGRWEESDHAWDVYLGVVTDIAEDALTIETSDGELIVVEGRSWSFAKEQGFTIELGDQVQGEGFYENDEFKVSVIENVTTGESIVLRDASGRPGWSRGGRGNV